MKVALVHDWLTGLRGGEKCLDLLCQQFPDADLFTLLHHAGSTTPAIERMKITTSFLQHLPGIESHYRRLLPLMPTAVERLKLPNDLDIVISLSHAVAKGVLAPAGVPHICYCFTPMRYAWHLRQQYFGNTAAHGEKGVSGRLLAGVLAGARDQLLDRIRDWDRLASDRVTHFVAISRTVQRRILECYGRDSAVIYPPVDTDFYCPAPVPRENFYLCVSALVPYKRIELAIEACNQLGKTLFVIGGGPSQRELARLAGPTVHLLGWCPDTVVRDHLRRCRALLFPGIEDFGIVPVEAQACGTPVVAMAQGGATETILGADENQCGTGRFFEEQTPEALCAAIRWTDDHPEQLSAEAARRQSQRFNSHRFEWEMTQFVEQMLRRQHVSTPERMVPAALRRAA